jgi:hypothetical protein
MTLTYEQAVQISLRLGQEFRPHDYVKYNTFVTFYAWLPSLCFFPFHIIFLLTTRNQTSKPISMIENSNDALPPKEVPFWGLIGES